MISIEKLIQQLQQCKDTSINLSQSNNNNKYIQKTAIEIRKDELSFLNTNLEHLNEANYTMDSEYEKLNKENENIKHNVEHLKTNNTKINNQDIIPNKSLIIYNENEIAQLPEIILNLFNYFDPVIDINLLYIYGIKNPESFYKSFLLLYKFDFIIKNNIEKKNEVATFKREMAVQYETFYKTLNYRKFKFSRNDMVSNLTNHDNYTDYDVFQYIADYTKTNFIILDIITEKYIDVNYNDNDIIPNIIGNNDKYLIIIKYSSNTYLPLMNSTGNHYLPSKILVYINKNYERLIFDKYKEPKDQNASNQNTSNQISYNIDSIDSIEDVDNIMEQHSTFNIEEAFNNSIRLQNENSIIKQNNKNISYNIEDMIDIEEPEEKPMNSLDYKMNTNTNTNTVEAAETITEAQEDLQILMTKIPMSKGIKVSKVSKVSKVNQPQVDATSTNTITTSTTSTTTSTTDNDKEEILPIGKYKLEDLQRLSLLYKIDTQKMGNMGKKINKLKAELYAELATKM